MHATANPYHISTIAQIQPSISSQLNLSQPSDHLGLLYMSLSFSCSNILSLSHKKKSLSHPCLAGSSLHSNLSLSQICFSRHRIYRFSLHIRLDRFTIYRLIMVCAVLGKASNIKVLNRSSVLRPDQQILHRQFHKLMESNRICGDVAKHRDRYLDSV